VFAPKVAKPQTKATEGPTGGLTPQRSTLAGHRFGYDPVDQTLLLQRSIGNQATLRLLAQQASRPEQEIAPDNIAMLRERRGHAWDFSKIPVFAPDRTNQPQASSPLIAPQVPSDPGSESPQTGLELRSPLLFARSAAPCDVRSVLTEPGHPLDTAALTDFQTSFGHDFSSVRVHTDQRSAASAASLSARAYTIGRHVVFGRGEYAPETTTGRHLLGHELAHVVQQSRGGPAVAGAANPILEAAADRAANQASRGARVLVAGSSAVGIACKTLFENFSGGSYSWNFLKLALEHDRPVSTIVDDVNALSSADRDQAIKDTTQGRTERGRKQTDLIAKQALQTDPGLQAVFEPILEEGRRVLARMDSLLDGLFVTISGSETAASLKSGTTAPTAAQKPLIESALKPDLRVTSSGTPEPFKECLAAGPCTPGDPGSYLAELRATTPPLIDAHWKQQVENKGKAEHDDPNKVHALSELERIGNASKRETDAVFGQYKKGPSLKADTKSTRGNIHDLWHDTEDQLKTMTAGQKREMARRLVFYFFQSDDEIASINAAHDADPKFTAGGAAVNQEAKEQTKVVDESAATPEAVKKLNEIDRGWDATAGTGQVNVQIFKKPDKATGPLAGPNVADRDFLWDMLQTLIHEYLHTLAHPAYNTFAETFGESSNQFNTLIEGVDSLLDEVVWSAVAARVTDPALRAEVEGPVYSKLPSMTVTPASRRRYPSYAQAVKLVNVVGIRNLYAAYFLGDVAKIKA
jgi:hypothetical protein